MSPEKVKEFLINKTISDIDYCSYLKWPMCIDSITCTDGTIIEIGGNADYGRIDGLTINGEFHSVEKD